MNTHSNFSRWSAVFLLVASICLSTGTAEGAFSSQVWRDIEIQQVMEVWVDDDFNEGTSGWKVTHFATIQEGVDAVDPDGTVYVAEGVYTGQVVIDHDLTLHGMDRNSVIVYGNGLPVCGTIPGGVRQPVICVFDNVSVTIDGFTIQSDGITFPDNNLLGIMISNLGGPDIGSEVTTIEIFNNVIELPIYLMDSITGSAGIEVYAGYNPNDLAVNLHHNEILGFKRGVFIHQCNEVYGETCSTGNYASLEVVSNNLLNNGVAIMIGEFIHTSPEVHFNRIYNYMIFDARAITVPPLAEGLIVNAEYNWWGCNEGPELFGSNLNACLPLDVPLSDNWEQILDVDPWLTLSFDLPAEVNVGQDSPVSADLLHTSSGEDASAYGTIPNGIEIEFSATTGTVDPITGETVNGLAATTYTAPEVVGSDLLCALLDGESDLCGELSVNIAALTLTDLDLIITTDQVEWVEIGGSFIEGFEQPLDRSIDLYYLDVENVITSNPLKTGLHDFYITGSPEGFLDYWASRGVVEGAQGWQGIMWNIINGDLPIFYLEVTGTAYNLIDGLQYELGLSNQLLCIEGSYLPGAYTFSGVVTDIHGQTELVSTDITFNDIPVGESQSVETLEDTPLTIALAADDLFPGDLTWNVTNPTNGILNGSAPDLVYIPKADWNGADSFTFTVSDGKLNSTPAIVTISITPVNDPPDKPDLADVTWGRMKRIHLLSLPFETWMGTSLLTRQPLLTTASFLTG